MKKIIYKLIILILIFSNSSIAQQQESWTTFTTADGLAYNSVYEILESSDGALWFGTTGVMTIEGGVSRYYQGNWTTFTTTDGLAANSVRAILESSDGALWFGTYGGGVSRYYQGNWTTFTTTDGLAANSVHAILESSDGALWFGTTGFMTIGGGVSRYYQGNWTTFTTTDGLADNQVSAIVESSDGALWFGTYGGGVSRYYQGNWTTFTEADGLADNWVNAILEFSDGALWFGTNGGGVNRYYQGSWTTFATTDGLADNWVSAIVESSDGALWFGTNGGGVNRYYQGSWTTFTTADGLADNWIRAILESSDGALWFGTNGGGVSHYYQGSWTTFTTTDGLADNHVRAILESSDGALWFGVRGGVSRYYQGSWTTFNRTDGLANNNVYAILESSDGALWFGTEGYEYYERGVSRYYQGSWTTFTEADGLARSWVYEILESSDGALWFGTYGGVSRYYQGSWTTFTTTDGLADNHVQAILESSDGALWFGTYGGGVSRYYKGNWTTLTTADGLADNLVKTIVESSNGALWFGTWGGGVSRLIPDKFSPQTYIIEGPTKITGTSTPMFIFEGTDSYTRQERLLYAYVVKDINNLPVAGDSLEFFQNTAIQPTPPLKNGTYNFYVWARDEWLNIDPTPDKWFFTVDITPPTITIISPKAEETVSGKVAIIGSAYDTSPIQDFDHYELKYAYGTNLEDISESKWQREHISGIKPTEIHNDTLALWDTEGLANGPYLIKLSAWDTLRSSPSDSLGHESHEYLQVNVVKTSKLVDARKDAYLSAGSGKIKIYLPPNAIQENERINIIDFPIQEIFPIDDPQITFTNLCFAITPEEIELLKPGTLTIIYHDSLTHTKNEANFALYHSTDMKEDWQRLGGTVNVEENKITTTFKKFGVFALYEDLTAGTKAGIFNVNSQPRIFSPKGGGHNTKTAISFELGKESNVTIKTYNTAGRLVRVLKKNEVMYHGNNVVYWDGKDKWGKFCVSGLYIVTIQAEEKMATKTVVVLNK